MSQFVTVGVFRQQEGVARPEVSRVGHVQIGIQLAATRAVDPTAVAQTEGVFTVGFHKHVGRRVEAEVVVGERLAALIPPAVEAGFGEGLFSAQAELGADDAKGLACSHVRRMHLLVVQKRVVHGVQPVRQENAVGQDGAVGLGVVEVRDILVPGGFPSQLQLALFSPRTFEVGLGDPARVLVVLPVERRHLADRGVGHQADVQEVRAAEARVV